MLTKSIKQSSGVSVHNDFIHFDFFFTKLHKTKIPNRKKE